MNYKITFSSKAHLDLDSIVGFYSDQNIEISRKFYNGIINSVKRLKQFLESGRIVPEYLDIGIKIYREVISGHYRIVYKTNKNKIIILSIVDSRSVLEINII